MGDDCLEMSSNRRFLIKKTKKGVEVPGDEQEDKRIYIISFYNKTKTGGKWTDLYEVRKSQIPKANMGLFALKNFAIGDKMGVYCGEVTDPKKNEDPTCYAMKSHNHACIVDCGGGVTSKHPVYFGLHLANDPRESNNDTKRVTRGDNARDTHNFFVDDNLVAIACQNIRRGDELFLDYGWETQKQVCNCSGCLVRDNTDSVSTTGGT